MQSYPIAVMVNNHTATWGSWYDLSSGTWGYACCHSIIHVSYCAGREGIEAALASSAQHLLAAPAKPEQPEATSNSEVPTTVARLEQNFAKTRVGEGEVKLDSDRLARAMNEEKKRKMRGEEDGDRFNSKKKRGPDAAASGSSHDVTEEELEAYRMSRRMTEDPMANYKDTDLD